MGKKKKKKKAQKEKATSSESAEDPSLGVREGPWTKKKRMLSHDQSS